MFHLEGIRPVLMAKDVSTSVSFYQRLGFELLFVDAQHNPKYAGITRDRVELHLQCADAEQWAYPTDRPVYRFAVDDVVAAYEDFQRRGAPLSDDPSPYSIPTATPWGTQEFHIRDPGLNILQFYQAL